MEDIKSKYSEIISATQFRSQNYEVIDFKKFIRYHLGIFNFFLGEDEIRSIREILCERKVNDRTCFSELGQIENIPFKSMKYYQSEVGLNGPMHTAIDEPVYILSFEHDYILWNGYHRSLIKIFNGELSVKGFVFNLIY